MGITIVATDKASSRVPQAELARAHRSVVRQPVFSEPSRKICGREVKVAGRGIVRYLADTEQSVVINEVNASEVHIIGQSFGNAEQIREKCGFAFDSSPSVAIPSYDEVNIELTPLAVVVGEGFCAAH